MKIILKVIIVIIHGLVGWALSRIIYYLSDEIMTHYLAIVIHFVTVPFIFIAISYIYFKFFSFTRPVVTALLFTGIVLVMNVIVMALLIDQTLKMFGSFFGTWVPLIFIFLTVYLTGFNFTDKTLGR